MTVMLQRPAEHCPGHCLDTMLPNSQLEISTSEPDAHEYLGNWDYEPGHEGYDCLDDFDLETMP